MSRGNIGLYSFLNAKNVIVFTITVEDFKILRHRRITSSTKEASQKQDKNNYAVHQAPGYWPTVTWMSPGIDSTRFLIPNVIVFTIKVEDWINHVGSVSKTNQEQQ